MLSATRVFNTLLSDLTDRQKDIVVRRFGLTSDGNAETLAAIGDRIGVTRERIRQIEAGILSVLKKRIKATPAATDVLNLSQKYLKSMGGVAREEELIEHHRSFVEGLTPRHVQLLIEATGAFAHYPENKDFWSFYYLDKDAHKKAVDFVLQFARFLKPKRDEVLLGKFDALRGQFVKQKKVEPKVAASILAITKKIHTNPYGDTGLGEWPEIRPRTIRDRIYLVLKRSETPLHFEDITKAINAKKLSKRAALTPTVHNELIKDARFVLVGRGIYALREAGYEPGTAKEVIKKLLKKSGPMNLEEIITAVQKDRFFKPNTILANLQNRQLFERLRTGTYRVRED